MSADVCSHGTPYCRACRDCERAQWSPEQVAEAIEGAERALGSPAPGFARLDPEDLRVLLDTARQALELRRRLEQVAQGRARGIEEAISVCELNMPYDVMGASPTIRVLFRRFTGELRKLRAAGSVEAYIEQPSAGRYE